MHLQACDDLKMTAGYSDEAGKCRLEELVSIKIVKGKSLVN